MINIIITFLNHVNFKLLVSIIIYFFTADNWMLSVWLCVFLLASIWDILSTYTFVYIHDLGWKNEDNDLIHWLAKYTNYHWASILHPLFYSGLFCVFYVLWPWPGFSIFIIIFCSVARFMAGIINFLTPLTEPRKSIAQQNKSPL